MDELTFGWRSALLLVFFGHFIVAGALLQRRTAERDAHRILAVLLLVVAGILTPQIIGFAGFYDAFPWLTFAPFAVPLALGPALATFIWLLTQGEPPVRLRLLFAPALLAFAYNSVCFLLPLDWKYAWIDVFHRPVVIPFFQLLELVSVLAGYGAATAMLWRYRRWLAQTSSAPAAFDLRGLEFALATLALPIIAWTLIDAIEWFLGPLNYFQEYPFHLLLAVAAYSLSIVMLSRVDEPFPKMRFAAEEKSPAPNQEDLSDAAKQLRHQMITAGWHLEARLTLGELAERTGLGESQLSRVINLGANCNFSTFVNRARIDEVKQRLDTGDRDVLAIALECGFNSKATFNRVFRETTGQTPSTYRRQQRARIKTD